MNKMNRRTLICALKELLRPTRFLVSYRYFSLNNKYSKNRVKIGTNTTIVDSKIGLSVFIASECSLVNTTIQNHSYLNRGTKINYTSIGAYCSIGSDVLIGVRKHPTDMVSTHPSFYANNKGFKTYANQMYCDELPNIQIGNDVWIGSKSTILGNVTIGDGAIVAYGSIVTKDIPPYAIVGGTPAKIIKYRFSKEIIDSLLEIKWWELSDEFFSKNFKLMHDPCEFVRFYLNNQTFVEQFRQKRDE